MIQSGSPHVLMNAEMIEEVEVFIRLETGAIHHCGATGRCQEGLTGRRTRYWQPRQINTQPIISS